MSRVVFTLFQQIFILILITYASAGCNEVDERTIPSEEQWSIAISKLVERVTKVTFKNMGFVYDSSGLDFLVTQDDWFVAIIASKSDTIGAYHPYIGQLSNEHLIYRFLSPIRSLNYEQLLNYCRLKENDSLYTLIGEYDFWSDKNELRRMWYEAINYTLDGDYTEDWGFSSMYITELEELGEQEEKHLSLSTEDKWTLAMIALLKQQEKTEQFTELTDESFVNRMDFFIKNDKWFVAIFSRRNDTSGIYQPIIGHLKEHILEYKYLHKENHYLEGESLEKYISLFESGTLWSLIEENKFWESDSALQRIFESSFLKPLNENSKSDSGRIMYLEVSSLKN